MRFGRAWASTCPTASSGRARPMTRSERAARLRGLYAVTPGLADTVELVGRVEAALRGGAAMLQYRAKEAPRELALEQARRLRKACALHDVPFIVNDSLELAL